MSPAALIRARVLKAVQGPYWNCSDSSYYSSVSLMGVSYMGQPKWLCSGPMKISKRQGFFSPRCMRIITHVEHPENLAPMTSLQQEVCHLIWIFIFSYAFGHFQGVSENELIRDDLSNHIHINCTNFSNCDDAKLRRFRLFVRGCGQREAGNFDVSPTKTKLFPCTCTCTWSNLHQTCSTISSEEHSAT